MPFISYAQNFEDVMLWRALKHVDRGFYIDVGACAPTEDSVTCAFSERGWRGINVEPNPYYFAQLVDNRPRDVNLAVAVGDRNGTLRMSIIPGTGLSTGDPAIAMAHASARWKIETRDVELATLSTIWATYVAADQEVHFLKIDVEGMESDVLYGNNWVNNRPWIVLVEATMPNSQVENHAKWEEYLVSCGYIFCYADGLNRFYLAQEHSDLIMHFKYPPNIFDGFQPPNTFDRFITAPEAVAKAEATNLRQALFEAETRLEQAKTELNQRGQALSEAKQAIAELNQRTSMLEAQLLALTSSSSWRVTEPLRRLAGQRSLRTRRNLRRAMKAAWWAITPWHFWARIRMIRERNLASKAAPPQNPRPHACANRH